MHIYHERKTAALGRARDSINPPPLVENGEEEAPPVRRRRRSKRRRKRDGAGDGEGWHEGESTRRKSISGGRKVGQTVTRLNRELSRRPSKFTIVCLRFKAADSRRRGTSSSIFSHGPAKRRSNEGDRSLVAEVKRFTWL